MTKILVVDDEKLIVKGISFSLQADGMEVDAAYDGESALQKIREKSYDLVILDLMLPGMDGMEVCQAVREFSDVPIIMLTAKLEDMNKILAFDKGVDDYLTKPFNILEVKARIKAILRRNQKNQREAENSSQLTAGELSVDTESRRVMLGKQEINLTAREFDILVLLMKNPDKVFSREKLLAAIWENRNTETGDVHVRRLREKIEPSPSAPRYVHTKWGVGYYFRATE